ncbi:MAG: hypothetical protein QME96_18195 [Myxococcota bacterium]|nr:hypothetical protein [Myxococcota bacterium]
MASEMVVPELRMGIRYEIPQGNGGEQAAVRDGILRRLGSVGVVVQDDSPPMVGERLTFLLDTPDGRIRFGGQVIVRLRGPGGGPWGFGAQIADVDASTSARLLAVRLTASTSASDRLQ